MTDLRPSTAFGTHAPRVAHAGALTLAEDPDLGLAALARRRHAPVPAPWGLVLPEPGAWIAGDGVAAFWMGPDQWMIAGPGRAAEDFAAAVRAQAPDASVVEQTDAFVALEVTSSAGAGPIVALLERLVNIDPARLEPNAAARTLIHHLDVVLIRRAPERLTILGPRSAAESLWHALSQVAARLGHHL